MSFCTLRINLSKAMSCCCDIFKLFMPVKKFIRVKSILYPYTDECICIVRNPSSCVACMLGDMVSELPRIASVDLMDTLFAACTTADSLDPFLQAVRESWSNFDTLLFRYLDVSPLSPAYAIPNHIVSLVSVITLSHMQLLLSPSSSILFSDTMVVTSLQKLWNRLYMQILKQEEEVSEVVRRSRLQPSSTFQGVTYEGENRCLLELVLSVYIQWMTLHFVRNRRESHGRIPRCPIASPSRLLFPRSSRCGVSASTSR